MPVKENTYVHIEAFMVNDLHLSGNELIIFACIYGFSQDGESWFTGSRQYLADWCQTSKKTVSNNLAKLCDAGYIEKRQRTEHGVTFCDYRVGKNLPRGMENSSSGGEKISTPPMEKSSHHTIGTDNNSNTNRNNRFVPPTVDEVRRYCEERGNGIDAQRFVDYYQARGWELGKGRKVKDWKACVRTWEGNRKSNHEYQKPTRQQPGPNDAIPDYDKDNIYKENGELDLEAMALNFWNK